MIAEDDVAGIDVAAVTAWLADNVDGAVAPFRFDIIAGGHSNLTYRVTGADGRRFVLRRPPLGHVLASAHDMGREHRIIAGLQDSAVPVPPALGCCDDPAVNGAPFYVMGFVDGHVVRDRADRRGGARRRRRGPTPAARSSTRWPRSTPSTSTPPGCPTSAATRATSPASSSGGTASGTSRRPASCRSSTRSTTPSPRCVPEQGPATIVHGDYRLDNTIVSADGDVVAVLDWEICTLGDPLADVGLLQVYWTGPDDEPSAWGGQSTTAPGFWDRAAARRALRRGVRPRPRRSSTSTSPSATGSWPASSRACTPATSAAPSATATRPSWRRSRAQVDGAAAQAAEHAGAVWR